MADKPANDADATSSESNLTIEVRDTLVDIDQQEWNALCNDGNPFLSYEFLYSLECTKCLGQHNGWFPRYFLLFQDNGKRRLVGAMPAYLKTNSYGEFVFDWAWAEAYERHNMPYYPKLVCSVPFTPATGQRILVDANLPLEETRITLANAARQFCHSEKYSGVHWLFVTEQESDLLCAPSEIVDDDSIADDDDVDVNSSNENSLVESSLDNSGSNESSTDDTVSSKIKQNNNTDILKRIDCQYHWQNNDYNSFDDFLGQCTAKRRKTIKRERRHVTDAALRLEKRMGNTLNETEWEYVHELYQSTFDRKWGNPSLTFEFFKRIGSVFGGNVLIVFVYDDTTTQPDKPIACSVMFVGSTVLYGRYWGCSAEHNSLHFEACYYQGIEYCIDNGLQKFEPGAQGEHKITRGFVPTITRSAHYIAHPGFRDAIGEFLIEERQHVEKRCAGLTNLLPFKHDTIAVN